MQLTLGSLFDGIGGWLLSAKRHNIKPIWSSEIEKFPMAVTELRFPEVKQLGDVTKLDGAKLEPVDIVCMGSPCQDLSVAGKRGGLSGERSGLFYKAIDIIRQMRKATNGKYPQFVVWENVPGAFSSNKGADFRAVLETFTETEIPMPRSKKWATAGMVRSDKCTVEWRVLDAQYWGVPQRRKRIFLVADYRADRSSGQQILFECEGVSRNTTESEREEEDATKGAGGSFDSTSTYAIQSYTSIIESDIGSTLKSDGGNYGGGSENYVVQHRIQE